MKYIFYSLVFLLPVVASAKISSVSDLLSAMLGLVKSIVPIVATLALIVFFWGLGRFILHSQSEDAHAEGRRLMFWGVIAIFILFSIWGVIHFLGKSIGIGPASVESLF